MRSQRHASTQPHIRYSLFQCYLDAIACFCKFATPPSSSLRMCFRYSLFQCYLDAIACFCKFATPPSSSLRMCFRYSLFQCYCVGYASLFVTHPRNHGVTTPSYNIIKMLLLVIYVRYSLLQYYCVGCIVWLSHIHTTVESLLLVSMLSRRYCLFFIFATPSSNMTYRLTKFSFFHSFGM